MTLSLLPVLISTVITIGILYVLYTKFLIKYMNFKGDGKDKLISYSFLIGLITFGMGLMTIFNELLFVQFNNSSIKSEVIERGIFTLIFYPTVFCSLGFILLKVFKKTVQEINQSYDSSLRLSKNHLVIGGGILGVILLISVMNGTDTYQTSSTSSSNKNEKEFNIKSCTLCSTDDKNCKDVDILKKIIVSKNETIEIYSDGSMKTWKSDERTSCTIVTSKNFMFYCNSFNPILNTKETVKFDGEKKYEYEYVNLYPKTKLSGNHSLNCLIK